jgi:hypothetical protein
MLDDSLKRDGEDRYRWAIGAGICVTVLTLASLALVLVEPLWGAIAVGFLGAVAMAVWLVVPRVSGGIARVERGAFRKRAKEVMAANSPIELTLGDGSARVFDGRNVDLDPRRQTQPAQIGGSSDLREAMWAASPMVGLAAVDMADTVHDVLALDDSVLNALTQLSGESIDGLADFRSIVDARGYDLSSIKLRGTVGEQESASMFEDAGVDVGWPGGGGTVFGPSNTPGFDMTVDGVPVNTKIVSDASEAAADHFATYPDIPIVVNGDAANIPEGALYWDGSEALDPALLMQDHLVIVQEGLTLTGIEGLQEAAHGAVDNIADGLDAIPGLSFVVVGVRSGLQQGRLVKGGHVDAQRALMNVSTDVLTKGGGAFIGAKSGAVAGGAIDALAGGMLLGIPTAAGMVGGAMAGGYAGTKMGAAIKRRHLTRAQRELQAAIVFYGSQLDREQHQARSRLDREAQRRQREFAEVAVAFQRAYERLVWQLREDVQNAARIDRERARRMLSIAEHALALEPTPTRQQAIVHWYATIRGTRQARQWKAQAWGHVSDWTQHSSELLLDDLMATTPGRRVVDSYLRDINEHRLAALSTAAAGYSQMRTSVVTARQQHIAVLQTAHQGEVERIQQATREPARQVSVCNQIVREEIRALAGK